MWTRPVCIDLVVLTLFQGAFVGTAVSLLFTLWMGMGQTVSLFLGTYAVPTKNTTIEGCPDDWIIDVDTEESGYAGHHFVCSPCATTHGLLLRLETPGSIT